MTPSFELRPAESITAWHRRIHETAHDWRDVAEFLTLRGLHHEARLVASVAHRRREERTVTLLGVAEERDKDAIRVIDRTMRGGADLPLSCGACCVWNGQGPCDCRAPAELHRLRQRARALRWAVEALMRPDPVKAMELVNRDKPEAVRRIITGPTKDTLQVAARVCAADAKVEADIEQREHLKRLADQMVERAGGLARSAAVVCGHNPCVFHCGEDPRAPFRSATPSSSGSPSK